MRDASVYARPGRPHWYVSYWCAQKLRRVHVATAWRVDDPSGHKLALRFAAAKSAAATAFRGHVKHEVWGAWVEKWLAERYRASPKTHQRLAAAWDWLRVFLDERGLHLPGGLTYNHALGYIAWRTTQKRHCGRAVSRNTALLEIKVLGLVMREAIRRGFATTNPCERLGLRREPAREKPEITPAEIARIRAALAAREGKLPVQARWMTTSFEIALHQGCRLRETQVARAGYDLKRLTIQFHAKGKKVFTTALHPALVPLLTAIAATGATHTCQPPPLPSMIWRRFFDELEMPHLSFHSTRVTCITRLARAGVPVQQAMRFVGHASETVHRIYQRLQTEDLSRCTQALAF